MSVLHPPPGHKYDIVRIQRNKLALYERFQNIQEDPVERRVDVLQPERASDKLNC